MIAQTLEVSKEVVSAFRLMAGIQELEKKNNNNLMQSQFPPLRTFSRWSSRPATFSKYDKIFYIAKQLLEWRKLRPFLMALSVLLSSFKGIALQIDPKNSCERYLLSHEWYLTTEIHVGQAGHLPKQLTRQ